MEPNFRPYKQFCMYLYPTMVSGVWRLGRCSVLAGEVEPRHSAVEVSPVPRCLCCLNPQPAQHGSRGRTRELGALREVESHATRDPQSVPRAARRDSDARPGGAENDATPSKRAQTAVHEVTLRVRPPQ
eukprot:6049587-Prymnesium_polylepis.1